jgi:thermitase
MSRVCASALALPLLLYGSWCAAALDPDVEPVVKPKVTAALLELLKSDAAVDLAQVCVDELSINSGTRFKPLPFPDIIVHLREGSPSLKAARLEPEPKVPEARLVYVNRDTGLGFIVVRFDRDPAGKISDQRPAVIALALHPDVRRVEPNCRYRGPQRIRARAAKERRVPLRAASKVNRTDPYFKEQWGLAMLPAPQAWKLADPQHHPLVAVLDSGVDCSNIDLQGQLRVTGASVTWPTSPHGKCPPGVGWDYLEDDDDPSDCGASGSCNPHGTHMAAIIAAKTNNSIGTAAVAPNAQLLIVRTLDESNVPTEPANRAHAIKYAVDQGASILNISQEWQNWADTCMQAALAYARSKNALVNIAAGNAGGILTSDAASSFPNVTYAMALENPHLLWIDSNRACWARRAILAPGHDIHGAIVAGNVRLVTGTSPATAFVSGAHALLWSMSAHQNASAFEIHELLFDSTPPASFSIQGATGSCTPQVLCLAAIAGGQCP